MLVLCAAGAGALAWSFAPHRLAVTTGVQNWTLPPPRPPEAMRMGVFHTGALSAPAALTYRGGGLEPRELGMDVVVVEHPQGVLFFDAGLGRDAQTHAQTVPWPARLGATPSPDPDGALVDQLSGASLRPESIMGVILTHAHWDHVSGLADLPQVPVWVSSEERAFIESGAAATTLARQLGVQRYQTYDFDDGPYWGFERSHDVFGDGSVVLVPAGGHTQGSTLAFIHTPDGLSYALIGDLAWQREGVELPAERPWLLRHWVDEDAAAVRRLLVHLHLLHRAMPQLIIVPAHDRRVMATLPPATRQRALRGH